MSRNSSTIRIIAEVSTGVALSTVLSMIKIYNLPQGGSITAGSMVPLLWISLRRGAKIGFFASSLFGLIQFILEPFFVHPIQLLLDYLIAFGLIGIAGFFKRLPIVGVSLALFGRFSAHFLSGVWFYSEYAPLGMSPFVYSALYNGGYIVGEFIVSVILIYIIVKEQLVDVYL